MVIATKQNAEEMIRADAAEIIQMGQEDPSDYMTEVLDVEKDYLWPKMIEVANSVRDNERTAVQAGHGVSKTFTAARIALTFLYSYPPCTVVTTAPTETQVKELLWREVAESHARSRIKLPGKLTSTMLDLQPESDVKWFAIGFSTRPDTITKQATSMQGYHNQSLLIIFDEAAGIMPEIWRAAEHIGAPFKRFLAIGNPTVGAGDFAESLRDPSYNVIKVSVKDTPNYKLGRDIIPGVYGREYELRIRQKYGEDSDEYKVRVLGEISSKAAEGAYYAEVLGQIKKEGHFSRSLYNRDAAVHIFIDPGYTTALWLAQAPYGSEVPCIRYYEDSGVGMDGYARILRQWEHDYHYVYGKVYVPCDMDSNAQRVVRGDTALDVMREAGFDCEPLPMERNVTMEGIPRTRRFLKRCWFDVDGCKRGVDCLLQYHERKNKMLSTEDNPVFTGEPEKCGFDHGADAMRYMSLAFESDLVRSASYPSGHTGSLGRSRPTTDITRPGAIDDESDMFVNEDEYDRAYTT